jgi:hypothetical protein
VVDDALTANFVQLIPTGGINSPSFGTLHDARFSRDQRAIEINGKQG